MNEITPIVNKVAQSGLITLNLEDFLPSKEVVELDLKQYLFKELLLREKDFRQSMKEHDWTQYKDKNLGVFCSSDAIIPMWAYMLVATNAEAYANHVAVGNKQEVTEILLRQNIQSKLDKEALTDQKVIIKGCGDKPISAGAYLEISRLLKPIVRSLMYGEACSTVPIYKKKRPKA